VEAVLRVAAVVVAEAAAGSRGLVDIVLNASGKYAEYGKIKAVNKG